MKNCNFRKKTNKRILKIFLLGIISISFLGCNKNNSFEIGDKSNIKIENNDVTLSIKEKTLTKKGLTLILTNNSADDIIYGNNNEIEIKEDGVWHKINKELNFVLPTLSLASSESTELIVDWQKSYGKLKKGEYRLIKDIDSKVIDGKFKTFKIAVEFEIK